MTCSYFHILPPEAQQMMVPERFTYPFQYQPHPLCLLAVEQIKAYLTTFQPWLQEGAGKMFGVLVTRDNQGQLGFVAAYSGNLAGRNDYPYFVPPVYDLLNPDGYFVQEEAAISSINRQVDSLQQSDSYQQLKREHQTSEEQAKKEIAEAKQQLIVFRQLHPATESPNDTKVIQKHQFLKAEVVRTKRKWQAILSQQQDEIAVKDNHIETLKEERKVRSLALQQWLFEQYHLSNANGYYYNLMQIFRGQLPPAGTGECCAPKMLQAVYRLGWEPLCMAEFWMGPSPLDELRIEGHFYPACRSKCKPILSFMLEGLPTDPNPLLERNTSIIQKMSILYEDMDILVVNKPSGMLSVPGKDDVPSVYSVIKERYPHLTGPLIVHRLDMDTSGILVLAKNEPAYQNLQQQFIQHRIHKEYVAILDTTHRTAPLPMSGVIDLPLCVNPMDRPRQMVSAEYGKPSVTRYQIEGTTTEGYAKVHFYPETGRTHQLRVHAAHPKGLFSPIVGDNLYGIPADRLYLHANRILFHHPTTDREMEIECPSEFSF